jgi:hypothetical protein
MYIVGFAPMAATRRSDGYLTPVDPLESVRPRIQISDPEIRNTVFSNRDTNESLKCNRD